MTQAPCLRVVVLSEDGSTQAYPSLVAVLKKAFQLLVPACQTHRIDFQPHAEEHRAAIVATGWRSRAKHDRRRLVDLRRYIATTLLEAGLPVFVILHFDSETNWSNVRESDTVADYPVLLVEPVRAIIESYRGREAATAALARLLPLIPCYSIEAWLYRNLAEARRIAEEQGSPAPLLAQLAAWESDPALLDEITRLRHVCALGNRHNARLATRAWPAEQVYGLGLSFTAAIDLLLECEELGRALEATTAA